MKLSRRQFLQTTTGLVASSVLPRVGSAREKKSSPHNIVFIRCFGGWDSTTVLFPAFENSCVEMERKAERVSLLGLDYVSHAKRVGVDDFFARFANRTTIIHGIFSPFSDHRSAQQYLKSGFQYSHPSWMDIISTACFSHQQNPHLCNSSAAWYSFFQKTLGNGAEEPSMDTDVGAERATLDLFSVERGVRFQTNDFRFDDANRDLCSDEIFRLGYPDEDSILEIAQVPQCSFLDDCATAVAALASGVSSCVSIEHPALWDSHQNNDLHQAGLWEDLFVGLRLLCQSLSDKGLSENTTVVVCSEMGRSPQHNIDLGKDHWPYSSALVISPHASGQRVIGGYDRDFKGLPIEVASGEVFSRGRLMTAADLGASILQMMDIDPKRYVPQATPIGGLFS